MPAGDLEPKGAVAHLNKPLAVLHEQADEVVSANQFFANFHEQITGHRLVSFVLKPADCASVFRRSHNAIKADDRSRAVAGKRLWEMIQRTGVNRCEDRHDRSPSGNIADERDFIVVGQRLLVGCETSVDGEAATAQKAGQPRLACDNPRPQVRIRRRCTFQGNGQFGLSCR